MVKLLRLEGLQGEVKSEGVNALPCWCEAAK